MKKILVLFCVLCISLKTYAIDTLINKSWQHSGCVSFSTAHISQNFIFAYMPYYRNHSLRLGLRINISNYDYYMNSASNNAFYQRGFAKTFGQKFGLNVGYQYNFKLKKAPHFAPYVFFDVEIAKLAQRSKEYYYAGTDSFGYEYRQQEIAEYEPVLSTVNTIGFGFKFAMFKNFQFDICAGVGISTFYGNGRGISLVTGLPISTFSTRRYRWGFDWEMVGLANLPMIRVGLAYTFTRK